jgi:uncharacterized peroxidase-related enzyme
MSTPVSSARPLYLPDVENSTTPSAYRDLITAARSQGVDYSKIWDLFAYQPSFTGHLGRFTQGVLREPASISPGFRELIAAYTSFQNECGFCAHSHAAAATAMLGDEALVWAVLRDLEGSPLAEKDKAMLRFVGKVTKDLPGVAAGDVDALRAIGWDDDAIYFAITTCALFNFYNRWISATGVAQMSAAAHREQGERLASRGYVRD